MAAPSNNTGYAAPVKIIDDSGNIITGNNAGLNVSLVDKLDKTNDSITAYPRIVTGSFYTAATVTATDSATLTGLAGTKRLTLFLDITAITMASGYLYITLQRLLPDGTKYDDLFMYSTATAGAAATAEVIAEINGEVLSSGVVAIARSNEALYSVGGTLGSAIRHAPWNDGLKLIVRFNGVGTVTLSARIVAQG